MKIRIVLAVLALIAVVGFVTMSLWNALIPVLFNGPVLGYWQTLGLLLLARIFFGGRPGPHRHMGRDRLRRKIEQRMATMSPEEREQYIAKWRGRFGGWHGDHDFDHWGPDCDRPRHGRDSAAGSVGGADAGTEAAA